MPLTFQVAIFMCNGTRGTALATARQMAAMHAFRTTLTGRPLVRVARCCGNRGVGKNWRSAIGGTERLGSVRIHRNGKEIASHVIAIQARRTLGVEDGHG